MNHNPERDPVVPTVKTAPPPEAPTPSPSPSLGADLRGVSQLAIAAVVGVTDIVEDMHRNIVGVAPLVGAAPRGRMRGIPGLVYRSIRGVTGMVGLGLNLTLAAFTPLLGGLQLGAGFSPRREALLAALNGVLGDHLVAARNPLAIPLCLRQGGQPLTLTRPALAARLGAVGGKLLVLAHGLCMNDLEWNRAGHDHGAALAQDLGYTPLYLHYNSGRHIATNGREFAACLEQLVQAWPVPVTELALMGHSMGGLVARSACEHARLAKHTWLQQLKQLICLGTPHHGSPLERAGHWVNWLAELSPYTAPLARLGHIRSAGVKDLRNGNWLTADETAQTQSRSAQAQSVPAQAKPVPVPLPAGVQCYFGAATTQPQAGRANQPLPGDGLVPVQSALGQHPQAALTLSLPATHQRIYYGLNHFDLLSSQLVYADLQRWLAAG